MHLGYDMKILLVNKFLYPRGGAESYMLKIGQYLTESGHQIEYFGMHDEKNTVGNHFGAYTQNMDFHTGSFKRFLYPFKIIYSLEAKRKMLRVLDDFKPDVVHLNNINFQLTPSIIDAAKKRNIPIVWTLHDYQLVCPNHLLYDFQKKCVCEKCVGRKKGACIRNNCIHGSKVKSILGVIEAALYRIKGTYKKVDVFICPSNFLNAQLLKDNAKLFAEKTRVIHNFVEQKAMPAELESNYDFPYIAFAGRLSSEKGTGVLAQAARLLPDVKFVVMGSGPEERAFEGLNNVVMTGFLTGKELDTNIACAKAMAVPSVCFENCPLSILEAQMLSVPSVTMNMGGMAELVQDHVTGVLSKSVSPEDFAAAIKDILSDEDALEQMKLHCKEVSQNAITLGGYCDRLIQIYQSVCE